MRLTVNTFQADYTRGFMYPATRRVIAMLKMHKRLRQLLSQSTSRVASTGLRKRLRKVRANLALVMDQLARAQFLEGMLMGPGRKNKYPSLRKRPKEALALAGMLMESEGAEREAIEKWTTPMNTKFFELSWKPVAGILDGYPVSVEDLVQGLMIGENISGDMAESEDADISTRLFHSLGQHAYRKPKIKQGVLSGQKDPRQTTRAAQMQIGKRALQLKQRFDLTMDQTDYVDGRPEAADEDTVTDSEIPAGGDMLDRGITRDDALLDLMTEGHDGANSIVEGLIRSVSSDRDRDVLRMVMDVAKGSELLENTTDFDHIVAERYRAETGEPMSPKQVSNIRRKNISRAMKPAYDGARVLADAIDEAGGSASSLRDIMIDNLLDTEELGPRLYDILPRAYTGGPRNKFWSALKQILIQDKEFLVSYEDLLQRMVEEVDPSLTSDKLIRGLGLGGSMMEAADEFVKLLAEDLIQLLMPIAEGMGEVDDTVHLRNELEMGRIRRAAARKVAAVFLRRKAKGKSKGREEIDLDESDMKALDSAWDGLK